MPIDTIYNVEYTAVYVKLSTKINNEITEIK